MAKTSPLMIIFAAIAIIAIAIVGNAEAAISCNQVRNQLSSCTGFLTGDVSNPQDSCCSAVQYINTNTVSRADRRATCQCLKDTASGISNLKDAAAQQLPDRCGVSVGVPISRTVDCNTL